MRNVMYIETPVGRLCLAEEDGEIVELTNGPALDGDCLVNTELLDRAALQLQQYFQGEREEFDLPLRPKGTDFQLKVWHVLETIPFGEVLNYGEVAKRIGCPKGSRAVGQACNKNPIMIFIPCHRVLGADGKLLGFGGGLDMKATLLELEKR